MLAAENNKLTGIRLRAQCHREKEHFKHTSLRGTSTELGISIG